MLTTQEHVQTIVNAISNEEQRLRQKYPLLNFQNTLGVIILLISLTGGITSGFLYYYGVISAWTCILISTVFASLAHEIEHDLIHRLYFRRNLFMHNVMMLLVWLMRPNTVNPWYRRSIHLNHHKKSGTQQDLEERLVGNGIGNPFLRFIVMFDGLIGLILQRKQFNRQVKGFSFITVFNAGFPLATLYFTTCYLFVFSHLFRLTNEGFVYPQWLELSVQMLDFIVVVLIAPNFIRSACLNIVTSYLHYYRGVDSVVQQTQVLQGWFIWPFNLFSFNFAGTHSIHHFVVKQPFYIRQLVATTAHKAMKENGVRFNDFRSFKYANRYLKGKNSSAAIKH